MLTRLLGQWRGHAAAVQVSRHACNRAFQSVTLDNTNRLEDGGVAAMSPAFIDNKRSMDTLVEHLQQLIRHAALGGGQKAIDRHKSRRKLLPRERISALLDPGSSFLELSQLAGHQLYGEAHGNLLRWNVITSHLARSLLLPGKEEVPAGGLVTGLGQVHGKLVAIVANDATGNHTALHNTACSLHSLQESILMLNSNFVIVLQSREGRITP